MKKYFHKLNKEERRRVLNSGMKIGEFMQEYTQPSWCAYSNALQGVMGCWGLLSPNIKVSRTYCKDCSAYIKPIKKNRKSKYILTQKQRLSLGKNKTGRIMVKKEFTKANMGLA